MDPATPNPSGARGACAGHPHAAAERECPQCGRPFCGDCLVEIAGLVLCGGCKWLYIRDLQRRAFARDTEANDALILSLLGVALCPCLLTPLALVKGWRALRRIDALPERPERWKALAALGISITAPLLYAILFLAGIFGP